MNLWAEAVAAVLLRAATPLKTPTIDALNSALVPPRTRTSGACCTKPCPRRCGATFLTWSSGRCSRWGAWEGVWRVGRGWRMGLLLLLEFLFVGASCSTAPTGLLWELCSKGLAR